MKIDEELIIYLEELSQITLGEDERAKFAEDLREILGAMAQLEKLNTDGVPERSHPFDVVNSFRDDAVTGSLPRELILQNAPVRSEEFFIAPKTVE